MEVMQERDRDSELSYETQKITNFWEGSVHSYTLYAKDTGRTQRRMFY
jgi:hypothetical protein